MDERPEPVEPPAPTAPDAADAPEPAPRGGLALRVAILTTGAIVLGLLAWKWSPADAVGPSAATPDDPAAAEETLEAPMPAVVVTVISALDDRFMSEPCCRIPGGGLFSTRAATDMAKRFLPNTLGIFMGDLTQAPGTVGVVTAEYTYREIVPDAGIDIVAVGEGELGLGSGFVRDVLYRTPRAAALCANAVDAEGTPLLRGWALNSAGDRNILTIAVAGESVGYEIIRRGSDVRIAPALEAARAALAEGRTRAIDLERPVQSTILLVHGTVEEAAAIVRELPEFDVAVAADGPILPRLEPLDVAGVPIHYGGRGARFTWRVVLSEDAVLAHSALSRTGGRITAMGSPYNSRMASLRALLRQDILPTLVGADDERAVDPRGTYIGSKACAECHPDEAAAHATSDHGRSKLPDARARYLQSDFSGSTGCSSCHVTGAFYRGGWSPDDDRGLAGIGCEACHGPGSDHVADPSAAWGRVDLARCYDCHLPDRTPGFHAATAWERSGHGAAPAPPPTKDDEAGDSGAKPGEDPKAGDDPESGEGEK